MQSHVRRRADMLGAADLCHATQPVLNGMANGRFMVFVAANGVKALEVSTQLHSSLGH